MSMSRQHYEKLARALGEAVAAEAIEGDSTPAAVHSVEAAYRVALAVAGSLADSSPRYNRERFIKAILASIEAEAYDHEGYGAGDVARDTLRTAGLV